MHASTVTASLPSSFVCNGESGTLPLEVLCNGTAQCSDNSDEINLLCEGMPVTTLNTIYDTKCIPIVYYTTPVFELFFSDFFSISN